MNQNIKTTHRQRWYLKPSGYKGVIKELALCAGSRNMHDAEMTGVQDLVPKMVQGKTTGGEPLTFFVGAPCGLILHRNILSWLWSSGRVTHYMPCSCRKLLPLSQASRLSHREMEDGGVLWSCEQPRMSIHSSSHPWCQWSPQQFEKQLLTFSLNSPDPNLIEHLEKALAGLRLLLELQYCIRRDGTRVQSRWRARSSDNDESLAWPVACL